MLNNSIIEALYSYINQKGYNEYLGSTILNNLSVSNTDESTLQTLFIGFHPFPPSKDEDGDTQPEYYTKLEDILIKVKDILFEGTHKDFEETNLEISQDSTGNVYQYQITGLTNQRIKNRKYPEYWATITGTDDSIIITQINYPQ